MIHIVLFSAETCWRLYVAINMNVAIEICRMKFQLNKLNLKLIYGINDDPDKKDIRKIF